MLLRVLSITLRNFPPTTITKW